MLKKATVEVAFLYYQEIRIKKTVTTVTTVTQAPQSSGFLFPFPADTKESRHRYIFRKIVMSCIS